MKSPRAKMHGGVLKSLQELGQVKRAQKVIILTEQGVYKGSVDEGLEVHEVNAQLQKALGSRKFKWYYLGEMLELKL